MKTNNKVVLFEDDPRFGKRIEAAIRKRLPAHLELVHFVSSIAPNSQAYEDALRKELVDKKFSGLMLIVSDRDLSRTNNYTGLSEAVVSKVANEMGIPICLYARGYRDELLERQRSWGDGRIVLDSDNPEIMALKICVLTEGFIEIREKLKNVLALKGKNRPEFPAAVMADILEKPELTDQIALYGSGDQKMVAEILPFAAKNQQSKLERRLPCLLGYWLYDSILRFPGLVVNAVAAASYLNIAVEFFVGNDKIQKVFRPALYHGPFQDSSEPLWWRSKLDDLISTGGYKDGNSLAKKKIGGAVPICKCSLDPKKPAGYYCVVTKEPVSFEKSHGNISWFPPGADLARIRNDIFDEMGPWLGLF